MGVTAMEKGSAEGARSTRMHSVPGTNIWMPSI